MTDGEIKLIASRRNGLILPPNLEEVMLKAEHWTVSYDSIQQLLDYAAVDIPAWPVFTRSVVLHVTDFPHADACNVICMFRTAGMDERWIKDQVPQAANNQYVSMAYSESREYWHAVVLGFGRGHDASMTIKPGEPITMATLLDGSETPVAIPRPDGVDTKTLNHAMGVHFWMALKALETRGLAVRTKHRNGVYHIGAITHAASTARN